MAAAIGVEFLRTVVPVIEPIGIRGRRGPIVLSARGEETSSAAATFAALAARRAAVDLRVGETATSSARTARELDATMIVLSALPSRWAPLRFSSRKASWLIAHTGCAVVSVMPTLTTLPRRCVAAIDFSVASIHAAQMALLVLDDCGTLMLVHVRPTRHVSSARHTTGSPANGDATVARFERLRAYLAEHAPAGAEIETQTESGGTVDQVLSVAREVGADLIAVGMHSPRVRNRLIDFGIGARLLRQAPCSVLASPVSRVARVFPGNTGSRYWATAPEWLNQSTSV